MNNKIKKFDSFVDKNKLDFMAEGSALNSVFCISSGYALYIGIENATDISNDTEFIKVFNYAKDNNYGNWWENEENRKQYKF